MIEVDDISKSGTALSAILKELAPLSDVDRVRVISAAGQFYRADLSSMARMIVSLEADIKRTKQKIQDLEAPKPAAVDDEGD